MARSAGGSIARQRAEAGVARPGRCAAEDQRPLEERGRGQTGVRPVSGRMPAAAPAAPRSAAGGPLRRRLPAGATVA